MRNTNAGCNAGFLRRLIYLISKNTPNSKFIIHNLRLQAALLCFAVLLGLVSGCTSTLTAEAPTRTFIDSVGREVQIPAEITKIAPSGPYAQVILYTFAPDMLLGLSEPFTRRQRQFIEEKYFDLPVYGRLYGGSGTFNLEEIIRTSPDIIIDMGERMYGISDDMDSIQSSTGIPAIFIEATIGTMAEAYDMLGDILGMETQAAEMSGYIRGVMDFAEEVKNSIPFDERPSVLHSQGEYGTEVSGRGSVHSEALDFVGVINAADIESMLATGSDEVSMEQIIVWNPDIVVLAPDSNFGEIYSDPLWAQVSAVQNRRVYEIPFGPYNWLGRPPSVQRVLGMLWLGNLVYPEYYDFDMIEKTKEFYMLFFRYDLSGDEAHALLANSTLIDRHHLGSVEK